MSTIADINSHDAKELYSRAEEYWAHASRDDDGMLGGFAMLHTPDIAQSRAFLSSLHERGAIRNNSYALDCGAGIGRVTKHLLLPAFKKVDMVDVVPELIEKSHSYIGAHPSMGSKFVSGLQDFVPEQNKYDLIWIQWVSGHLTNSDFVAFFERCKEGLSAGGVICLKDNIAPSTESVFDAEDHSWTRPEGLMDKLFEDAGLHVINQAVQRGFPKGMYKVNMYALKPKSCEEKSEKRNTVSNAPTLI